MKPSQKPGRPLKDVDSAGRAYFLKVASMFIMYGLITLPAFLVFFGWKGFFLWLLICLSLAAIVDFLTDKMGSVAGSLYTGRKASWSIREQMIGTLDEVRVKKMKGNYEQALIKVEEIISKDPHFPDAIFVKAQILYEGFHEKSEPLICINKVLELTHKNESVHRWALALKNEIEGAGQVI